MAHYFAVSPSLAGFCQRINQELLIVHLSMANYSLSPENEAVCIKAAWVRKNSADSWLRHNRLYRYYVQLAVSFMSAMACLMVIESVCIFGSQPLSLPNTLSQIIDSPTTNCTIENACGGRITNYRRKTKICVVLLLAGNLPYIVSPSFFLWYSTNW